MEKTLKPTIKQTSFKQIVNFKPVGSLKPFKLPKYYYFKLFENCADFKQSGRYFIRNYSGSVRFLIDCIPTQQSYFFKGQSGQSYNDFVNLYIGGGLLNLIKNIKSHVEKILPTVVENIINIADPTARENKKKELAQYYSYDFFVEQVSAITGDPKVQSQVLLYLLNPSELLKIQYEYMLYEDRQEDGGNASQMKAGAKDGYIFGITQSKYDFIDAINRKTQQIIAKNKELLSQVKSENALGTDAIQYINTNLTALYQYLGTNPITISTELRNQGNDLSKELNPDDYSNIGNKNTKSKGIDFTTILLLAIPIVAIVLIKKKGK